MDCEKFESTLLDELYDELDEVTSAAAKRHVSGCARCASLLSGLRATRRVAVLPILEPPAGLEDRILAAAREAQKVVPIGRRASRAISWAGSWAMRPQTGMAAVFLLMTGLSALLLRGKHSMPSSAMTVSEEGEPVPSATTGTVERPAGEQTDSKGAVALAAPMVAPAPAAASAESASNAYRSADSVGGDAPLTRARAGAGRLNAPKSAPIDFSHAPPPRDDSQSVAGAVAASPYAYAPGAGGGGGGAAVPPPAAPQASPAPVAAALPARTAAAVELQDQAPSGFASAMASYNAGDYASATTLFDGLAAGGDLTSALWAARSVRKGSGCGPAIARFDQVARAGAGTTAGYDATFEGGQCYRQAGQSDAAQARFRSLLTVTSYVDRAKNELAQMGPKASAKPQVKGSPALAPASQSPPANATKLPILAH